MLIDFIKMHGCSNDFMVIDGRKQSLLLNLEQIIRLADYKKSVGFDQLLILEDSKLADVALKIFNSDGSEALACGNGSRCVAKLILENSHKDHITIATKNRILSARWLGELVEIDMGEAKIIQDNMQFAKLEGGFVDVGNPHVVVLGQTPEIPDLKRFSSAFVRDDELAQYGPLIENDQRFLDKVNVNFVKVISRNLVSLRTWERGAGATLACGSGACASFAYLYNKGLIDQQAEIHQAGGILKISIENGHILMAGEAKISYRGMVEI